MHVDGWRNVGERLALDERLATTFDAAVDSICRASSS
jgi:hypothetical protein